MKKAIIFVGIYLFVTAILVYQVINPMQSEITIIGSDKTTVNIDSLIDSTNLSIKTELKNEIRKAVKISRKLGENF